MIKDLQTQNQKHFLESEIKIYESDFIDIIRKRLGIVIQPKSNELQKTILEICQKYHCLPKEFLNSLVNCEGDSALLDDLITGITIGETYFFRDKNQIQLLKEKILPELIEKKRNENNLSLRIWSAGCSSGEEIYTLAMILEELIPDIKKWKINLMGSDINTQMLKKAITGRYREWSMRSISEYYKKRYFKLINDEYILTPELNEQVNFIYLNLNDDKYPSIFNGTNSQDLILCRNVLIYFGNENIKQLMKKLSSSLTPGGYLMLGASDPISLINPELDLYYQSGMIFKKMVTHDLIKSKVSKDLIKDAKPIPFSPKINIVTKAIKAEKPIISLQNNINSLLENNNWNEALDYLDNLPKNENNTSFIMSKKAYALANIGNLQEAIKCCEISLKKDPVDKYTYLTQSMILNELDLLDKSEQALRKAIFLDCQFVAAHFQLGMLQIRKKQHSAGLKSLKNALSIISTQDLLSIVPGTHGLSFQRLADILQHEIEICQLAESSHVNSKK